MTSVELELCCMTVRQASLVELIDVAAAAGFGAITTTPWLFDETGVPQTAIRRRLERQGIRVTYVDGLVSALPGVERRPGMASEDDCFRIAEILGAEAINVVHVGGVPTPVAVLAEALSGVCQRAAQRSLRIVVEFVPETGIGDLTTAVELVDAVGAPNLGVVLDTWHLARSGGKVEDVVRAASRISALQISDRRREQDLQPYVPMSGRYLPGEGELELDVMVDAVRTFRPDVAVGIEVINDDLRAMPAAEAAGRAAVSLRRLLGIQQ